MGYETHAEVEFRGCLADIVAVAPRGRSRKVVVCEVKTSPSLRLLDQALHWRGWAHEVWVATPTNGGVSFRAACRALGIGVLCALDYGTSVETEAAFCRSALDKWVLTERTRAETPGLPSHRRWTAYRETCEKVRRYVERHPGCSLKELLSDVSTHYQSSATARSTLVARACEGKIDGVKAVLEDGRWALRPVSHEVRP